VIEKIIDVDLSTAMRALNVFVMTVHYRISMARARL
jgi:hypothetical protein